MRGGTVTAINAGGRSGVARAARRYTPRSLTEGERWTVETLIELRQHRYRPRAWARFLEASFARSSRTRHARPQLAAQARRWAGLGAVAWLLACRLANGRAEIRLNQTAGLAWWLAAYRMLDWHLGMAEDQDGGARERLSPADAVTMTRFWLVPVASGVRASRRGFLLVIAAGGLTDWLDGTLARRHGVTRLGRDLDTTADLAFFGTTAVAAARAERLPPIAAWSLLARYAGGTALSLVALFGRARRLPITGRPAGAALRVAGLTLGVAGAPRAGTTLLLLGCATPPRFTAPELSPPGPGPDCSPSR